jgi:uncharacterized membrane protein YqjE
MSVYPKQGGTITQLLGLAEDHARLALLEVSYEKQSLTRALGYLVLAGCALLSTVALLHVAIVAGLMALGWTAWQAALGLALVEAVICTAAWLVFRRNALRPDMFNGTRDELQRTFQWIHQHLN